MSILLNANESQLVLVDYQERLMPAIHEGQRVVERAGILAKVARLLKVPVFLTEQTPDKLGATDASLKALVDKTITKTHFSAVADGLSDVLRAPAKPVGGNARSMPKHIRKSDEASERNTIVLAGCEAHVCLMQTALELIEEEFDVWVVTDACSSRAVVNRDAAFDRLASNGAELVTTEMVVFEWLKNSQHPAFRDALQLVK